MDGGAKRLYFPDNPALREKIYTEYVFYLAINNLFYFVLKAGYLLKSRGREEIEHYVELIQKKDFPEQNLLAYVDTVLPDILTRIAEFTDVDEQAYHLPKDEDKLARFKRTKKVLQEVVVIFLKLLKDKEVIFRERMGGRYVEAWMIVRVFLGELKG